MLTDHSEPLLMRDVSVKHEDAPRSRPDGLSFTISKGEVVLLLGPSGSGKSTLALALNGLIPHDIPAECSGEILVSGISTANGSVAELSAHVSMVFQDPDAQLVTGTLLDEVCFGPENLELPVPEILHRAEWSLRQVGLWGRRLENPDRVSGGGRQRLAIACALAMQSPLIVLDEPTANLDPAGIADVYQTLREVVADGERAILLIEHNLDAAIDLVDRVVVIDSSGQLAIQGTVDEVLRGRSEELVRLGVWLPVATLAARQLASAEVHFERLPLTPRELSRSLDACQQLPALNVTQQMRSETLESEGFVRVAGLSVSRKKRQVLRDVSLELERGAFLAIVGTNGAGKTTLLQSIAGVMKPPRGAVNLAGLDPALVQVRELARTIGFVFQNPEHQFITHTVTEELAHGLRIQGVDSAEIARRVDLMLERFGLSEYRETHPFLLSGGQKRRLSVGTALIAGAPILALDEPTFGQDRERADELMSLLRELNRDGTTVLMVTHDMQLVADYASHIAVMGEGQLLGYGKRESVLAGNELLDAGLRLPPLAEAMRSLSRHEEWRHLSRLAELPGASE